MAYSQLTVTNANGASLAFTVGIDASAAGSGGGVTVERLVFEYQLEGDETAKGQDAGNHPSPVYPARLLATMTGKIIGAGTTDAAAIADYWSKRAAFMAAVLVDDGPQLTSIEHGRLTATPQNGSQFYADVVALNISPGGDIADGSNRISIYSVRWRIDRGFLLASADDSVVKL